MDRLVLWDIDRTLVTTRGFGRGLLSSAFEATTGSPLLHWPDMAGRTDRAIVTWILREHGVAADEPLIEAFFDYMVAAAAQRAEDMRACGTALPGGAAAIAAFGAQPGVVQTLVTGNLEPVARQKLTVFGLDAGIDFGIGGYGHIGAQRALLIASACAQAQAKYGALPTGERIVVIGDTPYDVEGALAAGVRAVGVATGRFSAADLHAAGAHAVLDSLADTAAVLAAAGSASAAGPASPDSFASGSPHTR